MPTYSAVRIPLPCLALMAAVAQAQTPPAAAAAGDRLRASFRDTSRPGLVRLSLLRGSIHVTGYAGSEVIVESHPRKTEPERGERERERDRGRRGAGGEADSAGLRRIALPSTGLTIEEENNVMSISANTLHRSADLHVQVPQRTSLKIQAVQHGTVTVENVEGAIEVSNIHGGINLTNVAGSVVAHVLHGPLTATLRAVAPNQPLSFSSLHGKIDVTLPASLKATLKLDSGRGDVYSDFDVVLGAPPTKVEESGKDSKSGKYRVSAGGAVTAQVNGGGQEITFKNLHGDIYIRKAK